LYPHHALCIGTIALSLATSTFAQSSLPAASFDVEVSSVVSYVDPAGRWHQRSFQGAGAAKSDAQSLTFSLPTFRNGGDTVDINLWPLRYSAFGNRYIGTGMVTVVIEGTRVQRICFATVSIKYDQNGMYLRGSLFGSVAGLGNIRTDFRGRVSGEGDGRDNDGQQEQEDDLLPTPDAPGTPPGGPIYNDEPLPHNLALPVAALTWDNVPAKFTPPSPDRISEVISVNDPNLREKLNDTNRDGWLVIRGSSPFPLGAFEFAGWVKIECPRMNPTWEYNSIRGVGGDDRLWLEGVEMVGPGDATIFQGVEYLYTDRCLFRNFGHVILDTGNWGGFNGCVLNTEFRENYHDPFQYFAGAVVNVAVTSMAHHPTAHPDLFQGNYTHGIYWKHVWSGTPDKPVALMGIRGLSLRDSYFEDVRHYRAPGTGHFSLDIIDATGTVFKNCVFTGPTRLITGGRFE